APSSWRKGTARSNRPTHSPRALLVSVVMLASSEWDVVVGEVIGRLCLPCRFLALRSRAAILLGARLALAAEHLHFVGDDVGELLLHPVVARMLAVADPALDVDLRTLAQVLGRDLAQLPEERNAVPFGLFLLLAVLALAGAGGSEADLGNRH